jgi:hypothetical protein
VTTYAVDWDGVCVDGEGEWLPGAIVWLNTVRRLGDSAFIHTSRALYAEGKAEVEAKLREAQLPLEVVAKPRADHYIDDKALPFPGYWAGVQLPLRRRRVPVHA